jgi:shikimate kinase
MAPPLAHIVLIGPMGVGKSTIGPPVAGALGVPFLDSDSTLEALHGRTAAEIAGTDGVPILHAIELEVFREMAATPCSAVIAPAESVVDSPLGRRIVAEAVGIRLVADPAILAERRKRGGHRRPIAADEAANLGRVRAEALASCTTWTIDTGGSLDRTVESILALLSEVPPMAS